MAVEHIVLQEAQTVALTGATYTLTPTTIYEDGRRPTECISKNGKRLKVALSNDDFNAIKVCCSRDDADHKERVSSWVSEPRRVATNVAPPRSVGEMTWIIRIGPLNHDE